MSKNLYMMSSVCLSYMCYINIAHIVSCQIKLPIVNSCLANGNTKRLENSFGIGQEYIYTELNSLLSHLSLLVGCQLSHGVPKG